MLKKVAPGDYEFLYKLLQEKEPYQAISHKVMPTYKEHVKFMDKKPYKRDYVIYGINASDYPGPLYPVGRIYLTRQNEVGIHIKHEYQHKGYGRMALDALLKKVKTRPIYANIAPANQSSQEFFEKHGFKLIQFTYARS